MKKALKLIALLMVLVLMLGIAALLVFPGRIIKSSIETFGPKLTGAPVTVEAVHLSLRTATLTVKDLLIGNPEGFKTDSAISLHRVHIVLDPRSVLTDTIVVREVVIDAPQITYELGLTGSNIGKLLDNMAAAAGDKAAESEKAATEDAGPGKKVVIDHVLVSGAKVRLSAKLAGGLAAPIPLPKVELHDVGREKEGGTSIIDATLAVFKAVGGAIAGTVTGAGKLLGKGAVAAGGLAVDGAKAAGSAAMAVGGAAADGAMAVGGAAVDGAQAVGGAAVGGAKAAGGMVVDGARAVGKGVAGLVGGIKGLVASEDEVTENDTTADEPAPADAPPPAP